MTTQWHAKRGYDGTTVERTGLGLGADGRAILFYDTDLTSWWLWNGAGWDAMGPGGDPHPQYVIIAPLASARNVIAAATATIRPLAIQTTDDDTTSLLTEWQDSGGTKTASVNAVGGINVGSTDLAGANIAYTSNRVYTNSGVNTYSARHLLTITNAAATATITGVAVQAQKRGAGDVTSLIGVNANVSTRFVTGTPPTIATMYGFLGQFNLVDAADNNPNISNAYAMFFAGNFRRAVITNSYGLLSGGGSVSSGSITNSYAASLATGTITGTGSITNAYGVRVTEGPIGAGAKTNQWGLHIADMSNATTNYAIQTLGGLCEFNAGAATVTPVHIVLAAAQSADALVIQNSTPAAIWRVRHDGGQVIQQAVIATGAPTPSLIVTSAAHTTLTASVERHEVDFNFSATQQWATGPTGTQRTFRVRPQTIAAVGASVFSNVSTVYIDGPPIAGANVTLTNTSALIIASGSTILGEATKQTNTGSLQLSGYWTFAEDAGDPTADADYGKMWTKSDNNLYFQDGDGVTHIIHGAPTFLSETVTTQGLGANPDIFAFGFYEYSVADGNLTQVVNVTLGDANVSHASHAFIVAGGAGATDAGTVGLRVTGTSITDAGVRTVADSETLSADITTLGLDDYLETTLKWLGTVTFELFIVGGLPTVYSLDINYGLAKYEDSMNIDFTISSVQGTGLAGAADADFDIQLYHHDPSGTWVYSAAAFTPFNAAQLIASLVTDHSTDDRLANQDHFAWKHTGLSQVVSGSTDEGFIILISSSANNAVEYCNLRVGVEF